MLSVTKFFRVFHFFSLASTFQVIGTARNTYQQTQGEGVLGRTTYLSHPSFLSHILGGEEEEEEEEEEDGKPNLP